MTSTARLLTSSIALALLAAGCDMGLQTKLDDSKDRRYAEAKSAVYAVESARYGALASSLPAADAVAEGREHPLLTWRKQILARDDAKTFERLSTQTKPDATTKVGAKGTPAQFAAELADAYVKECFDYWNGGSSHERYLAFIASFEESIAKHEADMAKAGQPFVAPPLLDEARFDRLFIHAAGFYQLSLADSRLAERRALLPYWALALQLPTRGNEDDDPDAYISRITYMDPAMKERCKGVPHEYRTAIIDHAYLELTRKAVELYKAGDAGKVFGDVMARFAGDLDKALANTPTPVEDPVLPATFAIPGGTSGLTVVMSEKRGIMIGDQQIQPTFDGTIPADLDKKALEVVNTVKSTPGNIINFTRIVVEAPGTMLVGAVRDVVRGLTLPDGLVKNIVFVGRRQADESMRKGVVNLQLMHEGATKTSSYQFPEDAAKTSSCALLGFMGEAQLGAKKDHYLEITPTKIRAIAVTWDKEAKEWKKEGSTLDLGSPSDPKLFEEWLDKTEGQFQLFLSAKFSYSDAMALVTRALFDCKDQEITFADPNQPTVMRTCGLSEQRRTSLVVSICD